MKRIVELKVLENYRIWLRFDDGVSGEVDFSSEGHSGVYAPWRDYKYFQTARIDAEGQLAWNDQLDFSADSLWLKVTRQRSDAVEAEHSPAHA